MNRKAALSFHSVWNGTSVRFFMALAVAVAVALPAHAADKVLERLLRFVDTVGEWRRVLSDFSLVDSKEGPQEAGLGAEGNNAIMV